MSHENEQKNPLDRLTRVGPIAKRRRSRLGFNRRPTS